MTWLQKGGPVVWPLLLLSLVATTVVIERILFWARARRDPSRLLEIARTGGLDAAERNMARGMVLLDTVVTVAPMLIGSGRPAVTLPPVATLDEAIRPPVRHYFLGRDVLFDLDLSVGPD